MKKHLIIRLLITAYTLLLFFSAKSQNTLQCPPQLNCVPNITLAGGVIGTGTTDFIPKWSSTTSLVNSSISQTGGVVNIPTLTSTSIVATGITTNTLSSSWINAGTGTTNVIGILHTRTSSVANAPLFERGQIAAASANVPYYVTRLSSSSNGAVSNNFGAMQLYSIFNSSYTESQLAACGGVQETSNNGYFLIYTSASNVLSEKWRVSSLGNFSNTGSTGTAYIHLKAGTTAASTAPLKFTSGSLNTAAEAGAVEFLTDKAYLTITTGAARKEITLNDAALSSGTTPVATTNGRLTDGLILAASTYTPTLTNTTNVNASAAFQCQYMRVGSVVTVSGKVQIDPTAAAGTFTELRMSLPIASDFTQTNNLGGTGAALGGATLPTLGVSIVGEVTSNLASFVFTASGTSLDTYSFSFTYLIQ